MQDDPFDTTKKRYTRVSKNGFDFNCKEISFRDGGGLGSLNLTKVYQKVYQYDLNHDRYKKTPAKTEA